MSSGPIPSNFNVLISDINTMFGSVYSADPLDGHWQEYTTEAPVTTSQLILAWTGMMPKARVWYGDRVVYSPAAQTYTAVPKPYEITYEMDQFHVEDDVHGAYFRWIPDMVRQTRRWQSLELRDFLQNQGAWTGTAQNGWDGLTYFNTAHQNDPLQLCGRHVLQRLLRRRSERHVHESDRRHRDGAYGWRVQRCIVQDRLRVHDDAPG